MNTQITINKQRFSLRKGNKPPKLRYKIGDKFQIEGTVYFIYGAFRLVDNPQEWIYCLEDDSSNTPDTTKRMDMLCHLLDGGRSEIPKNIVYDMFYSSYDAMTYFHNIPITGTTRMQRRTSQLSKFKKIEDVKIEVEVKS